MTDVRRLGSGVTSNVAPQGSPRDPRAGKAGASTVGADGIEASRGVVHYRAEGSPLSIRSVAVNPSDDVTLDGRVDGADRTITLRNDSGSPVTLPRGLVLKRDGLLWERTIATLTEDITLEPHQQLVVIGQRGHAQGLAERLRQDGARVLVAPTSQLNLRDLFGGASYVRLVAPKGQELAKLTFDAKALGAQRLAPSVHAPELVPPRGRQLTVPEPEEGPKLVSLPVLVVDADTPVSHLVARATGTFTPVGGTARDAGKVDVDLRSGSLSFVQGVEPGVYSFALRVSDGDNVREVRVEVVAKLPNKPPQIQVRETYNLQLNEAGEVVVPLRISDRDTPPAELVKLAEVDFRSWDGKVRQYLHARISPQGDALLFTVPRAADGRPYEGTADVNIEVIDPAFVRTRARTRVLLEEPNVAPTVELPYAEKTLLVNGDALVIPVSIGDANASQRDRLSVKWTGKLLKPDGSESAFQPEVLQNGAGVRFVPEAVGRAVLSVEVTDPKGASSRGEVTLNVVDRAPALRSAAAWYSSERGTGAQAFVLDVVDADTPLEQLSVSVDSMTSKYWNPGHPEVQWDWDATADTSVVWNGSAWELRTYIWDGEEADYTARLTVRDPEGNVVTPTFRLHHRTGNSAPTLELPRPRAWQAGSAERVVPIVIKDADASFATRRFSGEFQPAQGGAPRPFPVRTDADGNVLFDPSRPSGAEAALGTYAIDVNVTDPFGAQASGRFTVRVADDLKAPAVSVAALEDMPAPNVDGERVIDVVVSDPDTPLDALEIQVSGTVRERLRGRETQRDLVATVERTPEGARVHVPVRGGADSSFDLSVRVIDDSNQVAEAPLRFKATLPVLPPVVVLGPTRAVPASAEPLRVPVEIYDPNGDPIEVRVSAQLTPEGGGAARSVPVQVVEVNGVRNLELTPGERGTYDIVVTATEVGTQGQATIGTLRIEAKDPSTLFVRSPVWVKDNEFSSKGKTEVATLPGVAYGATSLSDGTLDMRGAAAFEAGREPKDAHATPTANHDSFDQAVMYLGYAQLRDKYEQLMGAGSFKALVAAKSGMATLVATANSMPDTNAWYDPGDESMHYGTAAGAWDLASDDDVVSHEAGHYVLDHKVPDLADTTVGGAMHEGYGDAQAAFLNRDPELSEDFGKVQGGEGQELRSAHNDRTVANTGTEVHERGEVFAGVMWDLGEIFHEQITGKPRATGKDIELLNADAADAGLMVLWTYPLLLGTRDPENGDFVNAVLLAVDNLAEAGKLPPGVNVAQAKERFLAAAQRRGLAAAQATVASGTSSLPAPVALGRVASSAEAAALAIKQAGFDDAFRVTKIGSLQTPNGDTVWRYRMLRDLKVGGQVVPVPVKDDLVTVVQRRDGTYHAQLGRLPKLLAGQPQVSGERLRLEGGATPAVPQDPARVRVALAAFARQNLSKRLDARSGVSLFGRKVETAEAHGQAHGGSSIPKLAYKRLLAGADKLQFVWSKGRLVAQLNLGTECHCADVGPGGELVNFRYHPTVIAG